jgi:uncharacterized protein (TIGR03435 family)
MVFAHMNKSMRWIFALCVFSAGGLLAQDITGTWQGTLVAPNKQELRTVIKISKGDGGDLKALFYSIDQGPEGIAGTVTVQGSTVKVTLPGIGGVYEGKLDGDAINLAGNFTQGAGKLPLDLKHVHDDAAWVIPPPAAPPKAMPADADPVFDVTVIKPSEPGSPGKGIRVNGRQLSTLNFSVTDMITFAYGIQASQITGAPSWMESEKYNLTAKPAGEGQPNTKQWKIMLQKMLADRFQLAFHHDKKELSVYAITVGKGGPKLTKSAGDPNGLYGAGGPPGSFSARNANMGDFAEVMQSTMLDRPVVDQTGLVGRFDFQLKFTPDQSQYGGMRPPPAADDAEAPPDLFTAMQEQLGLKLQATKAPVDVLVIDKVSKPSEN